MIWISKIFSIHSGAWYCRIHSGSFYILWKKSDKARITSISDSVWHSKTLMYVCLWCCETPTSGCCGDFWSKNIFLILACLDTICQKKVCAGVLRVVSNSLLWIVRELAWEGLCLLAYMHILASFVLFTPEFDRLRFTN